MKKYKDFINENISQDELTELFTFNTKVKEVSFSSLDQRIKSKIGLPDVIEDFSISNPNFTVTWKIDFGLKEWGIWKSNIQVLSIKGTYDLNVVFEDESEEQYFGIEYISEDVNFQYEYEYKLGDIEDFAPNNLEIDDDLVVITF